jgi:opacity protein-like surface antigen
MLRNVKWIVVLLVFCSSAFAISPVGPPKAGLETGQWSAGANYSYSEIDFDTDWGKAKNIKSNTYLAKFGYGINNNFELYGLLGMTDAKGEIGGLSLDGDYELLGGFGTKLTLSEGQPSWGLVYQMTFLEIEDKILGDKIDADVFDIFLAFGPTFEMGDWRIYGAPVLYYFDGDFDYLGASDNVSETLFGGYIGAEIDLTANSSVYAEYMLTEDSWLFGTGINWKF